MTSEAKYRQFCEGRLAITLAGGLAAQRAQQGSAPGWRRPRSLRELVAFHEGGHAVVAAAVAFHVHRVYLVAAESGVAGISGACVSSPSPEDPLNGAEPQHPRDLVCDRRKAAEICIEIARVDSLLLGITPDGEPLWKRALGYYRRAKDAARAIIEDHWYALIDLAEELQRSGDMKRADVVAILARAGL